MADTWSRVHIAFKDGKDEHYYMAESQLQQLEKDLLAYWEDPNTPSKTGGAYEVFEIDTNTGGRLNQPRRLVVAFNSVHHVG